MKRVELEWRHLDKDGTTCERCADTGDEVRRAANMLREAGWEVSLKEILLDETRIPESNLIRINGVPIEDILPGSRKFENCCASCGEILGAPVVCRTVQYKGTNYEALPASLILEAVAVATSEVI